MSATDPLSASNWNLSPEEAVALQKQLAARVVTQTNWDLAGAKTVAGIDISLKGEGQAAVVVLSLPDLQIVDKAVAQVKITFPYVPGLLSFRESPLALAALEKLTVRPDVLMVDGQGRAHPRRFGIACHLGLLTGLPSVGVAKSILCGKFENLGEAAGSAAPILHRGEVIGTALRAKVRTNPLIISVGNRMSLEDSVSLVQRCLHGYRLPEPTRQAHNTAAVLEQASEANTV